MQSEIKIIQHKLAKMWWTQPLRCYNIRPILFVFEAFIKLVFTPVNPQKQSPGVFCNNGVLKNFTKFTGNTCARDSFLIKFIKKESLAQVFSCEFCEFFKNTFFNRTPLVAASESCKYYSKKLRYPVAIVQIKQCIFYL